MTRYRSCCSQLAQLPGTPLLFNDVAGRVAVITHPRSRIILRWLLFALLVAVLGGLMAGSYLTSSELSSSVVVKREYTVTMQEVQDWAANNFSFTCPCSGLSQGTVDWAKVVPESVWSAFDLMKLPRKEAGDPELQAFCTGHALLGRERDASSCRVVDFDDTLGFNTPDNTQNRSQILSQYPGIMLQAPACRSIAGCLHHLRYSGFPSPFLLSTSGLQKTSQAALMGVIYSSAGQVQSQMMTRWSFNDVGTAAMPQGSNGYRRRLQQADPAPSAAANAYPVTGVPAAPDAGQPPEATPYGSIAAPPDSAVNAYPTRGGERNGAGTQTLQQFEAFNAAWNAFYPGTDDTCNSNASCANEACLLDWFARYVSNITLDYKAYFSLCSPEVCDVVRTKSAVTYVVSFLSTLGGLWGPLFAVALVTWHFVSMLPAFSSEAAAQQPQSLFKGPGSTAHASIELY